MSKRNEQSQQRKILLQAAPVFESVEEPAAENRPAGKINPDPVSWERFKLGQDGLIPCIVQDFRTGQVLMLAYMNREAYEMTCATGRMTYYSRSRQSIWIKGETSGHYQYVHSLSADCDWDTLLARVEQVGAACHTGSYSCFFRTITD